MFLIEPKTAGRWDGIPISELDADLYRRFFMGWKYGGSKMRNERSNVKKRRARNKMARQSRRINRRRK
jgi:hypothetical protein